MIGSLLVRSDGIFVLSLGGKEWSLTRRALEGISVSSLTQLASGTILAATHGVGVARSTDDGETWDWSNNGLVQYDLWAARSGTVQWPARSRWLGPCLPLS